MTPKHSQISLESLHTVPRPPESCLLMPRRNTEVRCLLNWVKPRCLKHAEHPHTPRTQTFPFFLTFFLPEKAFRQDAQLSTPVISDCIREKKSQQFRNFQTQNLSHQPIFRACKAWQDYGCTTAWVSLPGYWAFRFVHSFGFLLRGRQSPGQKKNSR